MAKKGLILALAVFIAGTVFAQSGQAEQTENTWYNSYAPAIDNNKIFINAGIGAGFSPYSMGIPPISASADFKLPVKLPITIGATAALSTWETGVDTVLYKTDITYTNIGFGIRAMYHFSFLKNLDAYTGLTLGYVVQTSDAKYEIKKIPEPDTGGGNYPGGGYPYYPDEGYTAALSESVTKPEYPGVSFFLFGINIGARYFFTDSIGAYLELGYSGMQFASIGLSIKI